MIAPGKTSFARMRKAAADEAFRIETSQDIWVEAGVLKTYVPAQISLRDDFAGIVRLLDKIEGDLELQERLKR